MRRTKIVVTLGPATGTPETIRALIVAGMNVARLNFSHGTHEEHDRTIRLVRQVAAELGAFVAILQDLQGPKIRTGTLATGPVVLHEGDELELTTLPTPGNARRVSTSYRELPRDVQVGSRLLLSDGSLELEVQEVTPTDVRTRVVRGGVMGEHTGINPPGVLISTAALTPKDEADLRFGVSHEVDFIAISFVRQPEDVAIARRLIAEAGADIPVIAKLEKAEAIANLDAIVAVSDGVMVARGDLGVEVPLEQVPMLQKRIIARANEAAKPVITATQMLESMIRLPRPTRAEVSDVANAILDGTDAVMLSAETAIGQYPVQAVQMMARIATEAEKGLPERPSHPPRGGPESFPHAIAEAAVTVSGRVHAAAIAAFTQSGFTALLVSKYRPSAPVIAVTRSERTCRRTTLYWGVVAQLIGLTATVDELLELVTEKAGQSGLVRDGDVIVITASSPTAPVRGATNLLEIKRVQLTAP